MVKKKVGVPVTMRALIQRINRKLVAEDEVLKTTRRSRGPGMTSAELELGDYYIVDFQMSGVRQKDVDPEGLGRELGVLKAWERVAE